MPKDAAADPAAAPDDDDSDGGGGRLSVRSAALTTLTVVALLAVFYFARDMLVPVAVAVVLYLLLSPAVRALSRIGVPLVAGAALVLAAFIVAIAAAVYLLASPAAEWFSRIPQIAWELQFKLARLRGPFEEVFKASKQVEEMATVSDETAPEVVVKGPSLFEEIAGQLGEIFIVLGVTFILVYFLLAYQDLVRQKLVRLSPRLRDKKRTLQIVSEIEQQVSRYLVAVTMVNLAVGAFVAIGMLAIGMPNPLLWAALAAFVSYIPFVGAWIGIGALALVALLTFDSLGHALLAPAIYGLVHMIADNFVLPAVLGRRLTLNPVAIVLNVIFWGWLWGIPGALLAGPILVMAKVLGDHVASLSAVGEVLGGTPANGRQVAARVA